MRLAVLTSGRQDWGILRSTCVALRADPRFDLRLIIGGMHLEARFGRTAELITDDGFQPREQLRWLSDESRPPEQDAGAALAAVGGALARQSPDALLLVGDRSETAAAAIAATLARVPIVHLHGGEETEGAFDNALRYAITKLAHLHLTSHPDYAARVIASGEDPATVYVVGAPGLDNLHRRDLPDCSELARTVGMPLTPPVVIVTMHPATLADDPMNEVAAVTAAMDRVNATFVITLPNSDPGNEAIRAAFIQAARKPRRIAVEALGERRFWGLLRVADAMLGNSSSALIEAPAVGVPAVNVGIRQRGRLRGRNVIDAEPHVDAVVQALRAALDPATKARLAQSKAPFGDGHAAPLIVELLAAWQPRRPPIKIFSVGRS